MDKSKIKYKIQILTMRRIDIIEDKAYECYNDVGEFAAWNMPDIIWYLNTKSISLFKTEYL